jgi:hypothetical protein
LPILFEIEAFRSFESIGVGKSAYHHQSHTEIASDNPLSTPIQKRIKFQLRRKKSSLSLLEPLPLRVGVTRYGYRLVAVFARSFTRERTQGPQTEKMPTRG